MDAAHISNALKAVTDGEAKTLDDDGVTPVGESQKLDDDGITLVGEGRTLDDDGVTPSYGATVALEGYTNVVGFSEGRED